MKKTIQANINGNVYYIDEDAYNLLSNYLKQIRSAFPGEEGHEIVGDKIRAPYGHTVPQIIKKEPGIPPAVLYHGTTHRVLPQILQDGLKPMQRQYVHLSIDVETATRVGKRRDPEPVILKIDTEAAQKAGIQFYIGNDKVWLCKEMPKDCLSIFTPET